MAERITKPVDTESPKSEFVREMDAAIERRLAAVGWSNKSAVDREIKEIISRCLGRDAWQAMLDAERDTPDVPRDTTRDRVCHKRRVRASRTGRRYPEGFDHKRAQAGDRSDDE